MRTLMVIIAACGQLSGATTFTKDVAPILFKNCVPCHHPGESTLFSLLRYEDVKKQAARVVAATRSRYMPPWLPEPGPVRFADERRLTAAEIATLERWVKEGSAEGSRADLPAPPPLAAGWQLGQPDLILTAPRAFKLPGKGSDVYRNFILPVSFPGVRYVRAVQIRPGDHGVVHHANLLVDRARSLRWRDAADGQPGFPGMDVEIPAGITDPESHFLFWKHGSVVLPEPKGMAWTLGGGSDLILNVHVKPTGKPEQIQPSIGLYFTKEPPQSLPILVQLENDRALDIPPGAHDFVVSDEFTLPVDADVLGVYPHAHYLGRDIHATAILPDGSQQSLIHIRHWDVNWQGVYRYAKPLQLPKGTRLVMRWTYDNSTGNRVTAGDQATDEMAHLWLQLLPRGPGDQRIVIQEAVARKRLRRDLDDFGAHFNLGGILQARNDPDGALRELGEAVRIRPRDEVALNTLGALMQLQGRSAEAKALYVRALASRPEYVDAHYNLAGLLLAEGEPKEAVSHLREVVRIDPQDARASAKLVDALQTTARALADSGHLKEAAASLRDVVILKPTDSDAHANLGVVLARQGEFAAAKQSLERSLQLNPNNTAARKNLERVQQRLQ
jgi:tetratricopeptide (TPR) repeat protein